MIFSETINDLFAALCKAQAEFPAIPKTGYNPHFKSYFSTLDDYERCCRPIVAQHNIGWSQIINTTETEHVLVTLLFHSSGQWMKSVVKLNPPKQDAQSLGAYISYMRRYALSGILGVSGSELDEDDGNSLRNNGTVITDNQITELQSLIKGTADPKKCYQNILSYNKITDLAELPESSYNSVKSYIKNYRVTP